MLALGNSEVDGGRDLLPSTSMANQDTASGGGLAAAL